MVTEAEGGIKLNAIDERFSDELRAVCALISPHLAWDERSDLPDPRLLASVARRHQVESLVVQRLGEAGRPVPPVLAKAARRAREAGMRQLSVAIALQRLFADAGVPFVFLKGLVLSQRAFGSTLARRSVDIDVLIDRADVMRAWEALRAADYVTLNPRRLLSGTARDMFLRASKDSQHRDPVHGIQIELHWRMYDDPAAGRLPPPTSWQTVEVSPGISLPTLGDADLFVFLCVHGAAHGWARLKWLADVAALLTEAPDGGIAWWRHAVAAEAAIPAASAILLAQRLLGVDPPACFSAPRSVRLRLLLRLAVAIIAAGEGARELEASPYRGWAEMAAKALVAPDWGGRLAVARRLLVSGEDVAEIALPKGLAWLYPLLRAPALVRRRIARKSRRGQQLRPRR
jgi:hypothetical protein